MSHVDLVANDWTSSQQVLIARVYEVPGGGVKVETDSEEWAKRLQGPLFDPHTGGVVSPDEDSAAFLRLLTKKYVGDYVQASSTHDEAACDWAFYARTQPMTILAPNVSTFADVEGPADGRLVTDDSMVVVRASNSHEDDLAAAVGKPTSRMTWR